MAAARRWRHTCLEHGGREEAGQPVVGEVEEDELGEALEGGRAEAGLAAGGEEVVGEVEDDEAAHGMEEAGRDDRQPGPRARQSQLSQLFGLCLNEKLSL